MLFLRQQISIYLSSFGIHVSPSSIMIVSGALQALQLIYASLLPQDSTILLEKPSYLFSLKLFQSMNMNFCSIPLEKEGLVLYIGSLSKSLSPGLRIAWIVGPEPVIERLADIKMQNDNREDYSMKTCLASPLKN